jgi:type IV pilus assembly protein PilM
MTPTPPGAVSKGVAADPAALAPVIRTLLEDSGIRSKRVVTALGGQSAIIRLLTMPDMPDEELERATTFEVERYLPAGVREVKHNYRVLGRRPKDGQLEILLVVAAKELVDRHMAPLAVLGLTSAVMEVTPFSMVRAVAPRDGNGDTATVYVDIGAESSDILVTVGERLRLARNIPIGGNALTKAIAEALDLDVDAARTLKEQRAQAVLEGEPADDLRHLHQAILPVISTIATELRRSLDFYQVRLGDQPISRVVLTGGTAKLKHLAPFLSGELGVPVELGNPFGACEAAEVPPEVAADVAPMMAVAVGLALRGAQD